MARGSRRLDRLTGYLLRTSRPLNAVLLVVPCLVLYNLAAWLSDFRALSGVDLVTSSLLELGGAPAFHAYNLSLLAGAAWLWLRRRKDRRPPRPADLPLLLGESAVYAALLGAVVTTLLSEVPRLQVGGPSGGLSLLDTVVLATGAGVHEELLFRLLLLPGLLALLEAASGRAPFTHGTVAVLLSSLVFALAHYLGPERFELYTFLFRTCAGALFGSLFLVRGFAVAVYTHTLYDLYVFAAS